MKGFSKIPLFFLISLALSACSISKSYLKQGDYDNAISAASYKLRSNKNRKTDILVLEQAFKIANERDMARINQLKLEGNPANYERIYSTYEQIRRRQELVAPLLPLFIKKEFRNADIKLINIDAELADSKNKTSEYLYTGALKLMESSGKRDIRDAYDRLENLQSIAGEYKDSKQKMNEALSKGREYVLIEMRNDARVVLPQDFETELKKINAADLNSRWIQFTTDASTAPDYKVLVKITRIDVTPERISEREYEDRQTIQDGWIYSKDKKGNVLKDSLGNDIKTAKMVTVVARIKETAQTKSCLVAGEYEFQQNNNGTLLKSIPFGETVNFENYYGYYKGDQRALSKMSKQRIGGQPLPFPPDLKMIMDANTLVKSKMLQSIKSNSSLFLN